MKSMGDMEQRLQTLEENVGNVKKTQESLLKNKEEVNNDNKPEQNAVERPVKRDTNLDEQHQAEGSLENFVGYVPLN